MDELNGLKRYVNRDEWYNIDKRVMEINDIISTYTNPETNMTNYLVRSLDNLIKREKEYIDSFVECD